MTTADPLPLVGLRLWLTRGEPESSRSAAVWRSAGAFALASPTVEVRARPPSVAEREAVASAAGAAAGHLVVALPSPRAVEHFVRSFGTDESHGRPWSVAAIGEATAERAVALGLEPVLVATRSLGSELARDIVRELRPHTVLLPSSDRRRPELGAALRDAGIEVVDLVVHRTVPIAIVPEAVRHALATDGIDLVVAYSPSALEFVRAIAGDQREALLGLPVAALGPTTSARARELGLRVVVEPTRPGEDALVEEVGRWWRTRTADRGVR